MCIQNSLPHFIYINEVFVNSLPSQPAKTVEKLDKIFVCVKCNSVFLFVSDVKIHSKTMMHNEITTVPFDAIPE